MLACAPISRNIFKFVVDLTFSPIWCDHDTCILGIFNHGETCFLSYCKFWIFTTVRFSCVNFLFVLFLTIFPNMFLSDPSPTIALSCQCVSFYWSWDLIDVTLACEDAECRQPLLTNVELNCWICQSWYMDLLKYMLHVFLALCQTKPSWSLTKSSKLVEASAQT